MGGPGPPRGPDPLEGKSLADDRPALVLRPQPVRDRDPDIGEDELVERVVTHDAGDRGDLQTRRGHVDQEHRDPPVPLRIGIGAHQQIAVLSDIAVGRPDLGAVDHVLVAVTFGPGPERGQIGTRVRLRESLAPDDVSGGDRGKIALLLLGRAVGHDRGADPVGVHVLRTTRFAPRPQLLAQHREHPR